MGDRKIAGAAGIRDHGSAGAHNGLGIAGARRASYNSVYSRSQGQGRDCSALSERGENLHSRFRPLGLIGNVERLLSQPAFGACPVDTLRTNQDLTVMPTLAAVEPPTPRNVHLYRAAVLVWRKAWREELCRHDGPFADRSGRVECVRRPVTPRSYPAKFPPAVSRSARR